MADLMVELQEYIALLAKQEREWHDEESPDLMFYSAHTTPGGNDVILKPLDLPDFARDIIQVEPRQTMRLFPEALHRSSDAIPRMIGESFFAWVVRVEAFVIKVPDDAPDRDELLKVAHNRQIHEHPDRVEVRHWSAASADGVHFGVGTERDSGEVHKTMIIRPDTPIPDEFKGMTINVRSLIRAARMTEWALGRWPRR